MTVYEHPAPLRVVEAGDEARDGGFSGPTQAHEGDAAPGLDVEVHPAQNLAGLILVSKVDVLKGHPALENGCRAGIGRFLHAWFGVEELHNALARDEGLANLVRLPAQGPERGEEEAEVCDEDGELPDGEGTREHLQGPEVEHERGPETADYAEYNAKLRLDERGVHAGPQGL